MTTIIRNKDVIIQNPILKPIYTPFVSEAGLIAGWRFGEGLGDLSGNGNTLSAVGSPTRGSFFVSGDKSNGYISSVADGISRTFVAVWRNSKDTNTYAYPVGNLAQNTSTTGTGAGLQSSSNSAANLTRRNGMAGANQKTESLIANAAGPSDSLASRLNFTFAAFSIDGTGNTANLYLPSSSAALIPATISSSGSLSSRSLLENGQPSMYRIISWRDVATPAGTESAIDVAEVLIFNRALSLAELQRTYARSQQYLSEFGQAI